MCSRLKQTLGFVSLFSAVAIAVDALPALDERDDVVYDRSSTVETPIVGNNLLRQSATPACASKTADN